VGWGGGVGAGIFHMRNFSNINMQASTTTRVSVAAAGQRRRGREGGEDGGEGGVGQGEISETI
jgi:hypothetical protein